MMKLYNTRTKSLEDFKPLSAQQTSIYSCGPTVYSHVHIGNLASFIVADTLSRILKLSGQNVKHVMNITDIDDKTVKKSQEQYPDLEPMQALKQLAVQYEKIFMDDVRAVGNDIKSLKFTKATSYIDKMQSLIRKLHEKGFAYIAEDGVYFSIKAYQQAGKKYGQLTNITTDSTSQARINNDEYDKESAHDFALWKAAKNNEPSWDFEIEGTNLRGRPGWHVECSAMSASELGQPFDIHTGGIDLKFPHHENEIAQSTATAKDSIYANFFVHNEHVLVNNKKMAKSENNFYTLEDVIKKGFDPLAFRLLILQSHYRKPAHFSWENLEAAQNRLQTFRQAADMLWQTTNTNKAIDHSTENIKEALQDDAATPQALTIVNRVFDEVIANSIDKNDSSNFADFLKFTDQAFGLNLSSTQDIDSQQKQLIEQREEARENKDWAKSDELRDKLKEQGIGLRDTPGGAVWFRIY